LSVLHSADESPPGGGGGGEDRPLRRLHHRRICRPEGLRPFLAIDAEGEVPGGLDRHAEPGGLRRHELRRPRPPRLVGRRSQPGPRHRQLWDQRHVYGDPARRVQGQPHRDRREDPGGSRLRIGPRASPPQLRAPDDAKVR